MQQHGSSTMHHHPSRPVFQLNNRFYNHDMTSTSEGLVKMGRRRSKRIQKSSCKEAMQEVAQRGLQALKLMLGVLTTTTTDPLPHHPMNIGGVWPVVSMINACARR